MRDFSFITKTPNFFTNKKADLEKRKKELFELEYITTLKEKKNIGKMEKNKILLNLKKVYRIK